MRTAKREEAATVVTDPDERDAEAEAARAARWVGATLESRDVIKWLATAIGAGAAVAFGAGPILAKPSFDLSSATGRTLALFYILSALVGALGAGLVVWSLLRALVPRSLTLDQVPQAIRDDLDTNAAVSYPGRIRSWEEFVNNMVASRAAGATYRFRAATSSPGPERDKWNAYADARRRDLRILRTTEVTILERAAFEMTKTSIADLRRPVVWGIVTAVIGVSVFQIVLGASQADSDADEAAATAATLVKSSAGASDALWSDLGLTACEDPRYAGRVPILVEGGTGAPDDPYIVQTLGTDDACPAIGFSITNATAVVETQKPTVEK